jgi:hypothetical protein
MAIAAAGPRPGAGAVSRDEQLEAVRSGEVEFATLRPPGSQMAVLDRRVVVTGPPALVELSRSGDVEVLDELVELLGDQETAWAAEVLLAAMTGREAKLVEASAGDVGEWWATLGQGARERWSAWLESERDALRWDPEAAVFTVR